jgi:hypothetical protein
LTISSSEELKEAHRSNMIRSWMLGGGNGEPAPTNNLRKLERERCNMTKSHMLGGGDKKLAPKDIWEGVVGLVNGNMFTHNC